MRVLHRTCADATRTKMDCSDQNACCRGQKAGRIRQEAHVLRAINAHKNTEHSGSGAYASKYGYFANRVDANVMCNERTRNAGHSLGKSTHAARTLPAYFG